MQLNALRAGNGELLTEAPAILEEAATQFSKTCAAVDVDDSPAPWLPAHHKQISRPLDAISLPSPQLPPGNERIYSKYTRPVFDDALAGLARNKAEGLDGYPVELLKYAPDSFKALLYELFGICILTAKCPTPWKESVTILLHKAGDASVLDYYRPIGLLAATYKLYASCLDGMIRAVLEPAGAFSESQEGFRAARNCREELRAPGALPPRRHCGRKVEQTTASRHLRRLQSRLH